MPQFKVKDGRELEILDNGITSDKAIIFHHGTPGHVSAWSSWLEDAASRGIRAISYSRAGYGTSDRNFGRSVLSNNTDISLLLDGKNISNFVAIGWSGGGPHALAGALDHRNVGVITLAGVGEYGAPDLDFLEGMGPENHDEFGAALLGEAVLDAWMDENAGAMKNVTGEQVREAFGGLIGDDDLAFVRPWGFKLSEISKPVFIWQGDDDFMVPHAHSKWLAEHIPGSQLKFVPGHGHISLIEKYRSEILDQAQALLK